MTLAFAPVASTAVFIVSKTGTFPSRTHSPPLPGVTPADDVGAVGDHLLGVEQAFVPVMPWTTRRVFLLIKNAHR